MVNHHKAIFSRRCITSRPRIAICFFGIDRSLRYTIKSIKANVYAPARELGKVRIYAHFFNQKTINNPRSGELDLELNPAWHLLEANNLEIEEPDKFIIKSVFEEVLSWGDYFCDQGKSLRNLFHQLYSLRKAYSLAEAWEPDVVAFIRPDQEYHDSLARVIKQSLASRKPTIFTPRWQQWEGGLNDRFAVCSHIDAAQYYSSRYTRIGSYRERMSRGIHSEVFLWEDLRLSPFAIKTFDARATRVRANGSRADEDFKSRQKAFNVLLSLRNIKRIYSPQIHSKNQ